MLYYRYYRSEAGRSTFASIFIPECRLISSIMIFILFIKISCRKFMFFILVFLFTMTLLRKSYNTLIYYSFCIRYRFFIMFNAYLVSLWYFKCMFKCSQVNCSDYNRCYITLEVNFLVNNIYLQYPTFYMFPFPYVSLVFPPNLYNIKIVVSIDCVNSILFFVSQTAFVNLLL